MERMMWCGVLANHRTPLVVIDGTLIGLRYTNKILHLVVLPYFDCRNNVTIFQHDNAKPHDARVSMSSLTMMCM